MYHICMKSHLCVHLLDPLPEISSKWYRGIVAVGDNAISCSHGRADVRWCISSLRTNKKHDLSSTVTVYETTQQAKPRVGGFNKLTRSCGSENVEMN